VINATPIGMGGPDRDPDREEPTTWPVDPMLLEAGQVVVDLVYHPLTTPWMEAAGRRGARVANGLGMLVHQAALQLAAWTGLEPPVEVMWKAVDGGPSGG
jgi:shikimate dehydrogenase